MTVNIDRVGTGGSYHLYALTNEELPDDLPPVIASLDPLDNAIDVPVYADLVVVFDRFIQEGEGNIILSNLTDNVATIIPIADSQVTIDELSLTINPDANFSALKHYAVLMESNVVQNQFGTAFEGISDTNVWSFISEQPESIPPVLLGLSPTNGTVDVSRLQQLVMNFDEPMRTGSGEITIKRLSDDAVLDTISVDSGNVTVAGPNVTIQPSVVLDPETPYYVELPAGALEDISSNPFAGLSGTGSWALVVHPIYFMPITSDGDSGISSNKLYTHAIDFGNNPTNYPVAEINGVVFANGGPGAFPDITGTSAIVGTGSSNLPATLAGNGGADPFLADPGMRNLVADFIYNSSNAQIELTGLIPGRNYQVRLYNRSWGVDGSREQIISFSTDGQLGAETTTRFNEDQASQAEAFLDVDARVNALTYNYTPTSTNLLINLEQQGAGTYHFYGLTNEEVVEDVPPLLVSLDPMDNATNVSPYTDLVATFDIPIRAGAGNIIVSNVTEGVATVIPATDLQVSINDVVLTINPTADLDPLDDYVVLIETNALTNPAGTAFAGITNATDWTFTIDEADITAPEIVSLDPANGETDVAILKDFLITVDEPVLMGSGRIVIRQFSDDLEVEAFDVSSNEVVIVGTEITLLRSVLLAGTTSYYVEIDAGAFIDRAGNPFAGISGSGDWRFTTSTTGELDYVPITGDADSGISTNAIYTHVLDFGQGTPGALVNGVQFAAYNNAALGTLNFTRSASSGTLQDHPGNGFHNVTGGLVDLLTDMYYNGGNTPGGTTTWTLSGLTPGLKYDTRIYVRGYGATPGLGRMVNLLFDPDGAGPALNQTGFISEDDATTVGLADGNLAYYISYTFTAGPSGELNVTAVQQNNNNSWHLYGLSNQEAGPREPFIFTDITYTDTPVPSASFTFNSFPGRTYKIEAKLDLHSATWIELVDRYNSQGLETTFVDTVAAGMPRVYYRVTEND
jgi:hypothetical protein